MQYLRRMWDNLRRADFAWGGMLFVAGSLLALLVVPSWQNNSLTDLRERAVELTRFVEDINDLEVSIQDMRLASRGYIISQNVIFHQQYADASARQQKVMSQLIQDAIALRDDSVINDLMVLKKSIDDWRVQRLDHQIALVESNNVPAAEADFMQSARVHAFDTIRANIDSLRMTMRTQQQTLQDETQRVHTFNLGSATVLACVALLALVVVVVGVWRQNQLLEALQHAKNESQQLTVALSARIDEIHHQNARIATAQDIVTQSMQIGYEVSQVDQIVQTIQHTLQLPAVMIWYDDITTNEVVLSSAVGSNTTREDIESGIDAALIARIRTHNNSAAYQRVRLRRGGHVVLYGLGNSGRSVGVLGVMSEDTKPLDELSLLQIALLVDNSRLFSALQREQGRLRVLFDVVPMGFVLVDVYGGVLVANQRAQSLLPGLVTKSTIQDVLTQSTWWSIGGNELAANEMPLMLALNQGKTSTIEVMHELAGERVPVRHQVVEIRDSNSIQGYVLVLEDMQQRYELDRLKADFVGMISHELRTPLAAIVGATTMLLNQSTNTTRDAQHAMLVLLQTQGQRLQSLIEDVLNLSRIDREGIRLQRERIEVLPLVQRIVAKYAPTNRHIQVSTQGSIKELYGDAHRIEQVFQNILENAAKYAPPGNVEITIQQLVQPAMVQFSIRDFGTPLSDSEYARVFDRFFQVNQRNKQGGVGLGLTICKYLVEAHGGTITMQATPRGDGTVVSFTIPIAEDTTSVGHDSGRGQRVLLVEDDAAVRRMMQHLLQSQGYEVVAVTTVFQGQEKIERNQFDVLIVDVMLPDGSGLDFVREVRAWLSVPILMVTALASEQDVIAGLRAGVDDYMIKPFNNDEFLLRVQALCRRGVLRSTPNQEPVITIGDIQVVLADKQIQINGVALDLTPIEYRLLMYLLRHAGQVLSHEQILQGVWGERYDQENQYLWVHISHVRRKLLLANTPQLHIENVRGIGYRMVYNDTVKAV